MWSLSAAKYVAYSRPSVQAAVLPMVRPVVEACREAALDLTTIRYPKYQRAVFDTASVGAANVLSVDADQQNVVWATLADTVVVHVSMVVVQTCRNVCTLEQTSRPRQKDQQDKMLQHCKH